MVNRVIRAHIPQGDEIYKVDFYLAAHENYKIEQAGIRHYLLQPTTRRVFQTVEGNYAYIAGKDIDPKKLKFELIRSEEEL